MRPLDELRLAVKFGRVLKARWIFTIPSIKPGQEAPTDVYRRTFLSI